MNLNSLIREKIFIFLGDYFSPEVHKDHVLLISMVIMVILVLACLKGQIRTGLLKVCKACRIPALAIQDGTTKATTEPNVGPNVGPAVWFNGR